MTETPVGSARNHHNERRKLRRRLEARGLPADEVERQVRERGRKQAAARQATGHRDRRPVVDIGSPEERLAAGRPPPSTSQRARIIERDGRWCRYCGTDVSETGLTIDHVTPVSRGGSNWPNNRVVACYRCNATKRARTLEEWGRPLLPPRGLRAPKVSVEEGSA